MEVKKLKLIYFSPTGTTRKVLESIAEGLAVEDIEHVDLTLPEGAHKTFSAFSDELIVIGAPVYGGRIPVTAIQRFKKLKASRGLAIPIVVYGNRDFEDALLELKDLAVELGFNPVAGGAFIGEHSFATPGLPIANGRPDSLDLQKAIDFGAKVKEKIAAITSPDARWTLNIPGRFPYEGGPRSIAASPVSKKEACTICGTCAGVCPTAAISIDKSVATRIELCTRCCACIKNCPAGARVWEDSTMKNIAGWLNKNCSTRREPQTFGIEV